ncbi:MAG: hypothetical protein PHN19_02525 [Patescibacteria group bacterium]|nr:hypothetical protein [Patescibacteria group bacterium]
MVDQQNPFDRVEKTRENARESGFANRMQEKTIDKQRKEMNGENKLNLRPDEQEDIAEKMREKEFKKEEQTQKKWWEFWK